jgi:DNA-binding transcriptional LysR family regulator
MNIHHLELFYFVAKHGGIAAAVRNIPYGIQQPAVSAQIARLEESLGTKLFQRRPFALSPAGVELFEFIRPFFDNVEIIAEKLRQNRSPQLRIAAPSIVLHDYLPELLQKLRTKFPEFRLYLHEARALKRKDYSWLGTLILRLPLSRKNRVLGFRFGHYLSCR